MTKDVRIELKLRNNLILTRMEELGIKNVAELCRRAGDLDQTTVGSFINLKASPLNKDSDPVIPQWRPAALALARALLTAPEDLFSENLHQLKLSGFNVQLHLEMDVDDIHQLTGQAPHYLLTDSNAESELQYKEVRAALREALATLKPRDRQALELRFGLVDGKEHTLEEAGKIMGVTKDRIRQLEARGLRYLRHPLRSKSIKVAGVLDYLHRNDK